MYSEPGVHRLEECEGASSRDSTNIRGIAPVRRALLVEPIKLSVQQVQEPSSSTRAPACPDVDGVEVVCAHEGDGAAVRAERRLFLGPRRRVRRVARPAPKS